MLPTRAEIKSVLAGLAVDASAAFNGITVVRNADGYNCATLPMINASLIDAALMVRQELQQENNAKLFVNLADSTAITNTTDELPFTFDPELTTPAGFWYAGRRALLIGSWKFSIGLVINFRPRLRINGVEAINFGNLSMGTIAVNDRQLYIATSITCLSVGVNGVFRFGLDALRVHQSVFSSPVVKLTGNNTGALTWRFTGQWGALGIGNTIVQEEMCGVALN